MNKGLVFSQAELALRNLENRYEDDSQFGGRMVLFSYGWLSAANLMSQIDGDMDAAKRYARGARTCEMLLLDWGLGVEDYDDDPSAYIGSDYDDDDQAILDTED